MQETFRKDRRYWTDQDLEKVSLFFQCNSFFNKVFQPKYLQDLIEFTYYAKIDKNNAMFLVQNRRSAAVILLKGTASLYKLQTSIYDQKRTPRPRKQVFSQELKKITDLIRVNETITKIPECKVCVLHDEQAEIVYVPDLQFKKFLTKRKSQKDLQYFQVLSKHFPNSQKKKLRNLAASGCQFKELKINDILYEIGDKSQNVFIIIEGSVKVSRIINFNTNSVVISAGSLIGQKDIHLNERCQNVTCCSAYLKLLQIPKEQLLYQSRPFIKFAKQDIPDLFLKKSTQVISPIKNIQGNFKLPSLFKSTKKKSKVFLLKPNKISSQKKQKQKQIEQKLIKNSHSVLSARKRSTLRIRSMSRNTSIGVYGESPTKQQNNVQSYCRIRFFQKVRDVANRMLD